MNDYALDSVSVKEDLGMMVNRFLGLIKTCFKHTHTQRLKVMLTSVLRHHSAAQVQTIHQVIGKGSTCVWFLNSFISMYKKSVCNSSIGLHSSTKSCHWNPQAPARTLHHRSSTNHALQWCRVCAGACRFQWHLLSSVFGSKYFSARVVNTWNILSAETVIASISNQQFHKLFVQALSSFVALCELWTFLLTNNGSVSGSSGLSTFTENCMNWSKVSELKLKFAVRDS